MADLAVRLAGEARDAAEGRTVAPAAPAVRGPKGRFVMGSGGGAAPAAAAGGGRAAREPAWGALFGGRAAGAPGAP
jgi:hypothetical protein